MPWNDYVKIKAIGSGSFGRAFLVQKGQKQLVMKEIDLSGRDPQVKRNTEVEVKVLSSLKHPYIVRYHESFARDGVICIVMDYCDSGDLWHFIDTCRRRREPIQEALIVRWFTQMCLGLKYMHEKRPPILHRDIKSQNIFLAGREGSAAKVAKIADFGISKVLKDQEAMALTLVGTPYYLSPEICRKQPYACPADVWALGCVLFEMCALRVPFDAKDMNELVGYIVRGPLPLVPVQYSRELQDLVAEALTRDAKLRLSASALLQRKRMQEEIKVMLHESRRERARDAEQLGAHGAENRGTENRAGGFAEEKRLDSARGLTTPRAPLAECNHGARGASGKPVAEMRGPSPSSGRGPSPHIGAAQEVLRPTRAPSPTPRGMAPRPC